MVEIHNTCDCCKGYIVDGEPRNVIKGSFGQYKDKDILLCTFCHSSDITKEFQYRGDADYVRSIKHMNNCFNYLAQRVKDASICNKIKEKYAREGCEITVGLEDNDETICEKYTDIDKENCYIRLSIKLNSIEICGKVSHPAGSDQCFRDIGINLQDPSICERIVYAFNRDKCFIGMKNKNQSICNKIENPESKDICLNQINEK